MKYRKIPGTNLKASEIGFGVWTLSTGWWGEVSDEKAVHLLRYALDRGINFFDTADTYGNGRGETLVGDALAGERDRVVIATKFGYDFYQHAGERKGQREIPQDFSPKFIQFACEESLKRLRTDHIDLYQIHNPKMSAVEQDDLYETVEKLKKQGKILAWGAALGPAIGWLEEGLLLMRLRKTKNIQMIYNLLEQEPGLDLFLEGRKHGTGFFVRVPHSSGMLEGKYTKDTTFDANDHRSHRKKEWLTKGLKKIEKLEFLTHGISRTLGQAALQFVLSHPAVVSVLPNIYGEEQINEFAVTSECPELTAKDLSQVNDLYSHDFYLEETEMKVTSNE